ncbi:MAG: hypothetical protein ACRDSE_24695 [Pseudonocardiaceae bacterium]
MLRRGGAVLAGLAGAGVASAVVAPAANAAPGDPVNQGEPNNAGASTTGLTSTATGGTLELANTNPDNAAPLRIATVPNSSIMPNAESQSGDLFNYDGNLVFTHLGSDDGLSEPFAGAVYTDVTANMLVPISPERVLDTRNLDGLGHRNILNKSEVLDAEGRLRAGKRMKIKLTDYVAMGTALNCNVTVVAPLKDGFVTLLPEDPGGAPETSTVNYKAGQIVGNFAVSGIGFLDGDVSDYVYIHAHSTTHVILDATAFVVGNPVQVITTGGLAALGQQDNAQAARQQQAAAYIAERRGGKR